VLERDGRMEGSRIFLTSTVYNKLTLRFKKKKATPTLYTPALEATPTLSLLPLSEASPH
jgi:hypothetical protein